jgi:phospholipase/carboxylesterase
MIHLFHPGTNASEPPLVLLHGSGGDEHSLAPLAAELAPGSPALTIRGTVEIDGGFAFFHRRPDNTVDEADVDQRLPALVDCIRTVQPGFAQQPIAVGFSNGAIMTAAMLLTEPTLLAGAILFRPLSPFPTDRSVRLDGTPVLIIDGEKDSRRSPGDGARLAERLTRAGAAVTHHVLPVGHAVTEMDKQIARDWLTAVG